MKNKILHFCKNLCLWFFFKRALCGLTHGLEHGGFPLPLWPVISETSELKNSETGKGKGGRDGDLEIIIAGSCGPGVADSEKRRGEERDAEDMPHDCYNEFNICACVGH